jgi:hypothetical protein
LDKENLGKSVAEALLRLEAEPLSALTQFNGAGIYAIYYSGDFPAYAPIAQRNQDGDYSLPIYVGKAIPPGGRRGGVGLGERPNTALFGRLAEHRQSIIDAENLDIAHFHCRYLLVDDIWIPLGESLLIAQSSPLWNIKLDGFGNHDPGSGRYNQMRSPWDTVHPGRLWATRCRERRETQEQLIADIASYLRTEPQPLG